MASLKLLVCLLLVTSTYSQPDWLSMFNLGGYGNSRPNNGYGVDNPSAGGNPSPGGSGGYVVSRPNTGGSGGYAGGSPNSGGSGGYVAPRPNTGGSGGYNGGPSTGGNVGYVPAGPSPGRNGGYLPAGPSPGGNGGYLPAGPSPGGNGGYLPAGPSPGGNGGYIPGRPSTEYGGGNPSTGTGVPDCKCRIPTLQCVDNRSNGNTAKCPAGYTAASCTCANTCGTTTFNGDSCKCECMGTDWASIRCCKNV